MKPIAAAIALVAVWGGCGPAWEVVRQERSLSGETWFALARVDFSAARVGGQSQEEWFAADANARRAFAADTAAIEDVFSATLTSGAHASGILVWGEPLAAKLVIRARVPTIDPGRFAYGTAAPSELAMEVVIEEEGGATLDELRVRHATPGSELWPTPSARLREDARALGELVAAYLRGRVSGEGL